MKNRMKRVGAVALTAILAFGIGATPAQAATSKALNAPVSFAGKGWDDFGKTRTLMYVGGDREAVAFTENYSVSYKLYIPKNVVDSMLKSKEGAMDTYPSLDLMDDSNEWNYLGSVFNQISLTLACGPAKGEPALMAYDTIKEENVSAKKYASLSKKGDYYLLNVKNLPMKKVLYDSNSDSDVAIDTSKKGRFNVAISVAGISFKAKSSVYVDDVVVKTGNTTLLSQNFEGETGWLAYNLNEQSKDTEISVKNFSTDILKLSKSSVSVKKGNTVIVKASTSPKATVTYKSANKKIATVTAKGVIKGVKAGKTTITVKANGISKKITVTVK